MTQIYIPQPKTIGQPNTIALENGVDLGLENGESFATEESPEISYRNGVKHPAVFANKGGISYLLNEDGSFMLQEDGSKILLDQSDGHAPSIIHNQQKS